MKGEREKEREKRLLSAREMNMGQSKRRFQWRNCLIAYSATGIEFEQKEKSSVAPQNVAIDMIA
jgi:hypothetical protein